MNLRDALEIARDALSTAIERYDCAGLTDLSEFDEITEAYDVAEKALKESS